jgi:hypothetical protein
MTKEEIKDIYQRLYECNNALEYSAFNHDGKTLDNVEENVIESTCPSTTCLIEVRRNKELMHKISDKYNL